MGIFFGEFLISKLNFSHKICHVQKVVILSCQEIKELNFFVKVKRVVLDIPIFIFHFILDARLLLT